MRGDSRLKPRPRRTAAILGALAGMAASQPSWAEVGAPERLPAPTVVTGFVWTVVVPVLLFLVAFLAAYALYRHFSACTPRTR